MGEPGAALAQAISPRELDGRYDERIKVDDELVLSLSLTARLRLQQFLTT
jgi:hypothetical protein